MSVGNILLIIVSGLGIFHGLFLTLILWTTRSFNNIANKVLGTMLLVLSLRVGKSVIMAFTGNLPTLYIYLGLCLMLFIGPLFLLYSKSLINKSQRIKPRAILHFAPGVVFFMLAIPMQEIGFREIPQFIAGIQFATFYIHFICYIIFVKLKIISQEESSPEIRTWLTILFYGLLAIWFEYVLNLFEDQIPYILGPIVYSITVYCITYLAFKHKYLSVVNKVKYQTTGFNEGETVRLYASVEKLMQDENLFLDPNITLASMGKRLKVSSQKLSMAVNSASGANFNEYLNKYRIDHAQKILKDPIHSNLSIAALAYEAGFNSLSTFNTAFKKLTGKTPSQFRNTTH